MKEHLEKLFAFDRYLLGTGYSQALDYINTVVPLDIFRYESGLFVGNWYVPDEWIIRDAWIKYNGEKIVDYAKDPLCVTVYSLPVNKKVSLNELKSHLHVSDECPKAYSYDYRFYEKDWGFSIPKEKILNGSDYILPDGDYEVFIDSEHRPGEMKVGVHTIPGKSKREILLFAHLDHPHQANDNLSGVVCLMNMAEKLKDRFLHTIKIIFCPETIGSIAYASSTDISQVDFVLSLDSIGNDNTLLFQKAYDKYDRLNYCMHLAVAGQGVSYRKGDFRFIAGSDEYYFNDPKVGIPGIFLSRLPYPEYHTSFDTPEKINYDKIEEVEKVILKCIDFYERDFIPFRKIRGPVMRSRYLIQDREKMMNRDLDYLMYSIDGKRYLSDIILSLGMGFDYADSVLQKLIKCDVISRISPRSTHLQKAARKK